VGSAPAPCSVLRAPCSVTMRLLGVTAGETTCASPMRVHALDGVRISGHVCSSSSVHRSRHTASVRFPLPTTPNGPRPLRGNGYRYPHEHVASQNQPVLTPKPFLPKYQRRPAHIYTSNLANTTSQYCAQRLSSEWRDATRCERFNGSSRSRAPQRRSYRYSVYTYNTRSRQLTLEFTRTVGWLKTLLA
jgi:hypothetical protein